MSRLPSHEHYKRICAVYRRLDAEGEADRIEAHWMYAATAPASRHTNGYRRSRRRHGYRAFPPRGVPRLVAIRLEVKQQGAGPADSPLPGPAPDVTGGGG